MKVDVVHCELTSGGGFSVVTTDDLKDWISSKKKIQLIKLYRQITGLGLKESKESVDMLMQWKQEDVFNEFCRLADVHDLMTSAHLSKEQFMEIISDALDSAKNFQCLDQLDALETLCANIRKKGGLGVIAKEYDNFINSI